MPLWPQVCSGFKMHSTYLLATTQTICLATRVQQCQASGRPHSKRTEASVSSLTLGEVLVLVEIDRNCNPGPRWNEANAVRKHACAPEPPMWLLACPCFICLDICITLVYACMHVDIQFIQSSTSVYNREPQNRQHAGTFRARQEKGTKPEGEPQDRQVFLGHAAGHMIWGISC